MNAALLPFRRVSQARFHRAMVARRALRTPEPEPAAAGPWGIDGRTLTQVRPGALSGMHRADGVRVWHADGAPTGALPTWRL
jgi:hypothetical protein